MKIFAIFDKKALSYLQPFFFHNKGLALRGFEELANDEKTTINKYPADFSIWLVGEWDDKLGLIIPLQKPEFVEEAMNVIKKEN